MGPGVVTHLVAFVIGHQAIMRKLQPCPAIFFRDIKDHFGAYPFVFIRDEFEIVVKHMPNHFLAGNKLRNLEPGTVNILVVIGESGTRSEEHTSELKSLMRISYAVFRLKKKIIIIYTTATYF